MVVENLFIGPGYALESEAVKQTWQKGVAHGLAKINCHDWSKIPLAGTNYNLLRLHACMQQSSTADTLFNKLVPSCLAWSIFSLIAPYSSLLIGSFLFS